MSDFPADDPRHGTYAGAQYHQANREPKCEDCREAARLYMRNRRRMLTSGRNVTFPLELPAHDFDGLGFVIAQAIRESA